MNSKKYLPTIVIILTIITFGLIVRKMSTKADTTATTPTSAPAAAPIENNKAAELPTNADQVVIVHFHGTQQCWSCIEVGKLAQKTLEANFAEELNSEKIIFKEINGELPANKDIVQKYQARGSSLFINAVKDDQDHIAEDTTVWRLINSEEKFNEYLTEKINNLLTE